MQLFRCNRKLLPLALLLLGTGFPSEAQTPSFTATPASFETTGVQWGYGLTSYFIRIVNNTASEITVTASVQNAAANPWLHLTDPSISIAPNGVNGVRFDCYGEYAVAGAQSTNIILAGPGGHTVQLPVTFTTQGKAFTVTPASVTLNGVERSPLGVVSEFTLSNFGPDVNFTLTSSAPWLFSGTGWVGAMSSTTSGAHAVAQSLMAGVYKGTLSINSPGYPTATVNVTFNVSGPTTTATPSSLKMTVQAGSIASANVTMTTDAPFPMRALGGNGWMRVTPDQFSSSPSVITIQADATSLTPGVINTLVSFVDAHGTSRFLLPIVLTVTASTSGFESFPTSVNFSAASSTSGVQQSQLLLTNRGSTANFTATSSASWLSVSPSSGLLGTNASASLTVQANPASLSSGRHEANLVFSAPGLPPLSVPVVLNIGTPAKVTVTPSTISLASTGQSAGKDITITSPGVPLQFDSMSLHSWLKFSPQSGTIPDGGTGTIRVWADPDTTPAGVQNSIFYVITGGNSHQIQVSVNNSGGAQQLTVSPVTLSLSATSGTSVTVSSQATLHNPGAATSFTTTSNQSWLSVAPSGGQLAAGSSASLSIQARAQGLAAGTHNGVITINAGGQILALPVAFTLTAPAALVVTPTSIEFNSLGSSQPARRVVSVTTQSGAAAQFTFTHQSPGNWLIVEQSGGQLSVGVNPLLLPSSPSTGTIQISPVPIDGRTYTVQVTARKASTPTSWAMPQVADGGDFTTSITLVNPSSTAATAALRFRRNKQDGSYSTEDWTPELAGGQSLNSIQIPAKSVVTVETLGAAAETSSGWVEVTGPSELGGFAVFRQTSSTGTVQEATVPMSGAGSARVVLPFDNISGWVTSFAAINRDTSAPLAINYDLRDAGGASLGSGPLIVLPAAGHLAARIIDIFPSSSGKRGSLALTASRDSISALALRFSPQGAFTSLETTPDAPSGAAVRQVFVQVADGGGFNTLLTLQNNNSSPVTANIRFRRAVPGSNGATESWSPQIEGSISTAGIVIPAGGTFAARTAGIGDAPTSGWAEVESASPLSGSAVFSFKVGQAIPQEASVALKAGQPAGFHLPFDNTLGFVTSIALANIDAAAAARLAVVLRDETGAIVGQETIDIPASGHLAFEMVNRLAATAGKRGSAEFTIQSGYVAAIGLRFSPAGPFTSFQPRYW